jgi:uncharacterized membrane protein
MVTGMSLVYLSGQNPYESWLVVAYGLYITAKRCRLIITAP